MHKERINLIAGAALHLANTQLSLLMRGYYTSVVLLLCGAQLRAILDRHGRLKYAMMFLLENKEFELDNFEWGFYNKLLEEDTGLKLLRVASDIYILGENDEK